MAPVVIATILAALGGYLLGSVPTGPLLAAARGVDLRAVGSGNIGAANAARALGRRMGVVVFAGDALKGFAPALVARLVLQLPPAGVAAVGFAAFLGHLFPIYLRFRGGKGVATAAGIFFAMAPLPTALALAAWIALFLPWHIVSIASLGAALLFPLALWLSHTAAAYEWAALVVVALILWKHRGNLSRLLHRAERQV